MRRSRQLSVAMFFPCNHIRFPQAHLLAVTFTSLSWHGKCLAFVQLTVWLWECQWNCLGCSWFQCTFKPFILCAHSNAGCRQVLWYWCLGTSSFSSGRPQPTWRFCHFSLLHPQTWSGAGHSSELFLIFTSVPRIFTNSERSYTEVLFKHAFSQIYWWKNTYCPKFFEILASGTQNLDTDAPKKGFWD